MKQTIYCNCFYCVHYEDKICTAPELHITNRSCETEFEMSQEKLNAYLDQRLPNTDPPCEYGYPYQK